MKASRWFLGVMALVGALQSSQAISQEVKAGDLVISLAWCRAAPSGADAANCYLTIENKGAAPDRLVGGSVDVAPKLEIRQISAIGGGLTDRPVGGGLIISPNDKAVFAPGGYHLAFLNLKSAMKKGSKLPVTLEFEKAGKVNVTFDVLGAAAKGPPAPKAPPAAASK
jgi:copper(I)-binding protein